MYYGTKLPLESSTNFLKASNLTRNQWKLLSFKSFFDNFELMLPPHKIEDFQLISFRGNSLYLFVLVEMFSLELVAELPALKFLYNLQKKKCFFQLLLLQIDSPKICRGGSVTPAISKMDLSATNVQLLIVAAKGLSYVL